MRGHYSYMHRRVLCAIGVVAALVAGASIASAQPAATTDTVQPSDLPPRTTSNPGFLFSKPRGFVGVSGGWMLASAGSDLFEFVTSQLTIDRHDFNTGTFSPAMGFSITDRIDLVFGANFSLSATPSEYRDFVDNALKAINQDTSLREADFTASVKVALTPRGRRISRFSWIPSTLTPYAGAGGGAINYQFRQTGDFVDFVDLSVFASQFRSEGWAPSAHVFGGVDMHLYRRLYLSVEGRYVWASAKLGRDFVDFAPIDLGGFRIGAGAHLVF